MKTFFKQGQITLGIAAVIAVATVCVSIAATFFTTQASQTEKTNDVKSTVLNEIGSDRERISKLEEAVSTIKSDTTEIKNDIKTIIKQTK